MLFINNLNEAGGQEEGRCRRYILLDMIYMEFKNMTITIFLGLFTCNIKQKRKIVQATHKIQDSD